MKVTACSNSAGVQADVLPKIIRQNMYRLQEMWKKCHQIFMSKYSVYFFGHFSYRKTNSYKETFKHLKNNECT